MRILRTTFCLVVVLLAQCDAPEPHRETAAVPPSGAAAARADLAAGRPLVIYTHVMNGVMPGWQSPGLSRCSPVEAPNGPFWVMTEAEFNEGVILPPEQEQRAGAAVIFGAAYNREAFRIRRADVLAACPQATSNEAPPSG